MAVKNALAPVFRSFHRAADTRYYRRADCDVGYKVAVHDVNVQPVRAFIVDDAGTFVEEVAKIGGEN